MYCFGMGLCICCYYVGCIFVVMVLKVHLELLFSNRVALVQYLFICSLLFKLMKKHRLDFNFPLCPWVISLVAEKKREILLNM